MTGAGKRNKYITIQEMIETTSYGEVSEAAQTLVKTWAAIEPVSSRETWLTDRLQATTTHTIRILFYAGITTRHQATYNGRTFRFESVVNPGEANRELVILATEVI